MKRLRLMSVILTGILILTMCASCGSAGQTTSASSKEQEASAEQEAPAGQEQEASQEQEAAPEQEASQEQEAAPEQEASQEQETPAEQESGSGDLLKALFGEGGPLADVLPEGTDVDAIMDAAAEQMGQANQELEKVFDEITERAESQTENFSEDSLKKFAELLMRQLTGQGEYGEDADLFGGFEEIIRVYGIIRNTQNDYIREYNAGLMDVGEVQIVSNDPYYQDEDFSQDEIRTLSCMIQNNYTMDEENQLRFVSGSEDVVLFTQQNAGDDSYPVVDAKFAEKGDNYLSSIEALYNEAGEPVDELELNLASSRIMVLSDLKQYMEEHPDVKGIEFEGEIRTAEELYQLWSDRLDELFAEPAEDAGEGVSTAPGQETAAEQEEAAQEQEGETAGLIRTLFGEGGPLADVLPEGTDVDAIIAVAGEQMEQADQELQKVFGEIAEKVESQSEIFSEDSLKEYAEALLRQFTGLGEFGDGEDFFDSLDAMIAVYTAVEESENEYIKERNAASMDVGDVQIVSNDSYHQDETDQEEFRMLSLVIQNNYRMDEENNLRFVNSEEDFVLFTHQNAGDGSYPVVDAAFAEKGDNYLPSIEAMITETGESVEDLERELESSRIFVLYDLENYLKEHPDVKGIEFEGEIRTAEELDQLLYERFGELYPETEEDAQTEDAASDVSAESASGAA